MANGGTTIVKVIAVARGTESAVATKEFTINESNVTLYASATGNGSIRWFSDGTLVNDEHVVLKGTTLNLEAKANTGYEFSKWTGDTGSADVSNPILNIEVNGDKTIGAEFETADALPEDEAIAIPVFTPISGTKFETSLKVTISSSSGTTIYYERGDGKFTAGENPFTIYATTTVRAIAVKNGYRSKEAVATFTKISDLPDLGTITKPTITPPTGTTFGDNLEVTITNTNPGGGRIYYALGGAKFVPYSNPFTITGTTTVKAIVVRNGKRSNEAVATFTKNQYTLTVTTNPANGTITSSHSNGTYPHGTKVTLNATADSGYRFTSWSGVDSSSGTTATVTMTSAKTVTATFTEIPSYVVGEKGPGGGWIFQDSRNGDWYEVSESLGLHNWDEAFGAVARHNGGGLTDWELPNKEVLNEIWRAKRALQAKGFPAYREVFWSSSQINDNRAWGQYFNDGPPFNDIKRYNNYVLAVRAFNP